MTRIVLSVFFATMMADGPIAAQDARLPRPWEPGFVNLPTATPKAKDAATTIIPFASKFNAWPDLVTSVQSSQGRADRPLRAAPREMNVFALPTSRAIVLGWTKSFPDLGDDFEVLAKETAPIKDCIALTGKEHEVPGTYNCIAYTAGIKNMWVSPYQTAAQWDLFYKPLGYTLPQTTDTGFVPGYQKVAVYGKLTPDGRVKECTHAALQNADGTWSSKLGSGPLVRHRTAEAVCGPLYGEVVRVYVRKK